MPAVLTRPGAPLPYELKSIHLQSGQRVQHAVMKCCVCRQIAQFPFVHAESPILITKKFERLGWEVYKSKARCPDCKHDRAKQKAAFARLNEGVAMPIELVKAKSPEPEKDKPAAPAERIYFLTIAPDGTPTLRPLEGVKEMLLGDDAYLVVPAPK